MKKYITPIFFLAIFIITSAYRPEIDAFKTDISGYWIRQKDNLQINISSKDSDSEIALSYIIREGNEEFPCDVEEQPIYKNIIQRTDSLWTCDFLVVTINDCSSEYYYTGKILLTDKGQLEVVCPGFKTMYYNKKKPRHGD